MESFEDRGRTVGVLPADSVAGASGISAARTLRGGGAPEVMSPAMTQRYRARQIVFHEATAAHAIFQLLEGALMVSKTLPDGRRQVLEVLGPGDYFGMVTGPLYDCTAETLTPVALRRLDRQSAERSERVQKELARQLLRKVQAMHDHALLLGRKTAAERIASLLLSLQPQAQRTQPGGAEAVASEIVLPLSQADIADYLGLTLETVCRQLSLLRREGIVVAAGKGRLRIADRARLEMKSGSSPEMAA